MFFSNSICFEVREQRKTDRIGPDSVTVLVKESGWNSRWYEPPKMWTTRMTDKEAEWIWKGPGGRMGNLNRKEALARQTTLECKRSKTSKMEQETRKGHGWRPKTLEKVKQPRHHTYRPTPPGGSRIALWSRWCHCQKARSWTKWL